MAKEKILIIIKNIIIDLVLISLLFIVNIKRYNASEIIVRNETIKSVAKTNINSSLETFYKGLENKEKYIKETSKFNCSTSGCITSNYNNIGLISTYEYNLIGGRESYLKIEDSFFALNNNVVENITPEEIQETTDETTSGLRPVA